MDLGPGDDRGFGGRGNDTIGGFAGDDVIWGNQGADTLRGDLDDVGDLVSQDRLHGGRGDDKVYGGDGNDRLFALSRKDVHGPGDDEGDTVRGGNGDDRIAVRDGERDFVDCGPGIDRALLDFKDVTDNSCEVVARRRPNRADSRVEDRNEGDQP